MIVTVNSGGKQGGGTSPLRQRKKREAMKRAQAAAIRLFGKRGFPRVSIEEVAAAAELSPASIYRYFGTKENLVIWDEDENSFFERLDRHLATLPPFRAFTAAITDALGPAFKEGVEARSDRLRLIFREQALLSARRQESLVFGQELAKAFAKARLEDVALCDLALGAAAASVLDVALEAWAAKGGAVPIAKIVDQAFACLDGESLAKRPGS